VTASVIFFWLGAALAVILTHHPADHHGGLRTRVCQAGSHRVTSPQKTRTRDRPSRPGTAPADGRTPARQAVRGRRRLGTAARRAMLNGAGLLVAAVTLPILWMVSTAFKPEKEIYAFMPVASRW
jgi:hypothetical protein